MVFPGSSGALCLTKLETALEQKQGDEMLVLSCKVIQRLQPLQHESNKEKVLLTIMFCYQLHLCIFDHYMYDILQNAGAEMW